MAWSDPISDAQVRKIAVMMKTRNVANLPEKQESWLKVGESNWRRMDRQQASNAIAALELCEVIPTTSTLDLRGANPAAPVVGFTVDEGRYWIVDPRDGEEKFIHVEKPTEGKWAGYTFLKVRASDNLYPIRDRAHREAILEEIAKDPIESMRQYGLKLGTCGRCGITLTHPISRAVGFGPICCEALGVEWGIDGQEFSDDEISELLEG